MVDNYIYDVFLSHSSQDKQRASKLAVRLKQAGLRVWFDEWALKAGDDIRSAVESGLKAARVQVLCLSPAALGSDWVSLERSTVLFRSPTDENRRFVPVLLVDCAPPDTLRRYKFVDCRQETEAAFAELLAACRANQNAPPATSQLAPNEVSEQSISDGARLKEEVSAPIKRERSLSGQRGWILCLAVSPDGSLAASGSEDNTIKIWNVDTGKLVTTFRGHADQVRAVAITPDGKRVLSGSDDGKVCVWEIASGLETVRLQGHADAVTSVTAARDSDRALSGGWDKYLRLWDLKTGNFVKAIKCKTKVLCATASPDGTRALSGHSDGTAQLWDLKSGECLATLKGHKGSVNSIQASEDWSIVVSGSHDSTVKIWDIEKATCIGTLEGHKDSVPSVAISSDGALVASAGANDISVRIWDSRSGACLGVIELDKINMTAPISCALSPDGSRLLVGTSRHQAIHVYRLDGNHTIPPSEGTRRYVNAKIVLVGEGTVGKTSLAHRLIEDKYVVKDRTHGMNVWQLPLPVPPSATMDHEALLWDFAGQEDYRLIHQLFLDQTALALMLINPQSDDPFADAGDWLKALDVATRNEEANREANRLLIFSQIDVGGMKIGNAKIERFIQAYRFTDWLATSAKSGENCSDGGNAGNPSKLKQLITNNVPWNDLPWTATPRLLTELKTAIVTMRDEADIRLLRFSELAQRVKHSLVDEQIGDSDVRTAVKLLANHGLARQLKFGDLVLLQPELLNGYASAIIRAARVHRDEIGCVLEADVYDPGFDFTGVDRLPRPDEELLLRAIVQTLLDHSLCIAEETPLGRQLAFPSQYRREKEIPWQPDVFVSYTFRGEWQTIWTTLVVRLWYSHEFEHRELWRNAAEFNSSRGDLLGMKVDNQQGEGKATISLFFDAATPDELKVIFLEYVHRHLARYGTEVTRDRRYVCTNCATPITDLAAVRSRVDTGRDFITCQICDNNVPLIDFIEQRMNSDPVARQIFVMEERATQALDEQALEQILMGHIMAICGEANQVFRPVTAYDYGIDGELEFKDDNGQPSGKKIYLQLKSGNSYLRTRRRDGHEVFDVKNDRHLNYWVNQPVDVFLVIRQTDDRTGEETIRWMNVTRYLKSREDKQSRQIIFNGESVTMKSVWKLRDDVLDLSQ